VIGSGFGVFDPLTRHLSRGTGVGIVVHLGRDLITTAVHAAAMLRANILKAVIDRA
jgi:hypothetical protein